jgi:hypothetical protein
MESHGQSVGAKTEHLRGLIECESIPGGEQDDLTVRFGQGTQRSKTLLTLRDFILKRDCR